MKWSNTAYFGIAFEVPSILLIYNGWIGGIPDLDQWIIWWTLFPTSNDHGADKKADSTWTSFPIEFFHGDDPIKINFFFISFCSLFFYFISSRCTSHCSQIYWLNWNEIHYTHARINGHHHNAISWHSKEVHCWGVNLFWRWAHLHTQNVWIHGV